ncbi:MAG TPA: cyclopropane-fatty-acyl-phospholipid synthase family protein [Burkholderiales bacterium]|nr:cyclopropane-fatty-acyl-phospholipid synthase family protein [Burkholderiales bacterium]
MKNVERILRDVGSRTDICFRVVFGNGTQYQNRDSEPAFTVTFRNRIAEWRTALLGHVGLLESYVNQSVDIDGDLALAFRTAYTGGFDMRFRPLVRLRNRWHEALHSNASIAQAKKNARFHYAIGTDFYRLWLDDPYMMYTCAYWKEGTTTLEEAQQNKMEHVCRKLLLKPGETLLDIGCGWGGFSFYAAERYGVVPTGLNTTPEQLDDMRAEIARRGLEGQIHAVEADFREVPGEFDKCASIGVLEHAGRDQIAEVVQAHADCLKPGGIGLLHFIGHVGHYETEFFVRKYVFPGGWIPGLAETITAMERAGLEILDIENLRRNYALTLDAWSGRFDANWERIRQIDPRRFDERFRRIWRTYLYSCAEMFRARRGYTHLFQITYSKGNAGYDYPMSRAHLYS